VRLPLIIRTTYILGKLFFGEEWIGPTCCMICICMIELNLKSKLKKLEVNSNQKSVTHNVTQIQLAVTSLSEIEILRSTHRCKGYEIIYDFGI
jgi:hypothetical protein